MKKWFLFLLILALLLPGCSARSKEAYDSENGYYAGGDYAMEETMSAYAPESPAMDSAMGKNEYSTTYAPLPQDRKLIRTIRVEAETEDMDTLLAQLNSRIAALGGYIQNQNIWGSAQEASRSATLVIRIPADSADSFLADVQNASNILSSSETVDDVTLTYVTTESRLKALEAEQERLLELMEQAQNMDELLQIESRLTDVRYQLEAVGSQLRTYDNQINYATITLNLQQVKVLTPVQEPTVWDRIGSGFAGSLQSIGTFFTELFIFVTTTAPVWILLGGLGAGGIVLVKVYKKKKTPKEPQ